MTDPWSVQGTNENTQQDNLSNQFRENNTSVDLRDESHNFGFEDSFIQDNSITRIKNISNEDLKSKHQPLPDSETYLQGLEHKLEKLKKGAKLVEALSEKRDDCLRSMLQNNSTNGPSNGLLLELETSISNSDSAVQNLYRQIQPVQPVTVGETVHIVKYDQLEEQRLETESEANNEDIKIHLSASR